jgi:hypothetical protein
MANLSDYLGNKWVNMLRGTAFSAPAAIYVALFTASTGLKTNVPSAEVTGTGYVRQAVTLIAPTAGVSENSADVTFPTAGGDWGTITHIAIVDHATNTNWGTNVNVLLWGPADAYKEITLNDIYKILAGDLDLSLA